MITDLRGKLGKGPLVVRVGDWTPERMQALLTFTRWTISHRARFRKALCGYYVRALSTKTTGLRRPPSSHQERASPVQM